MNTFLKTHTSRTAVAALAMVVLLGTAAFAVTIPGAAGSSDARRPAEGADPRFAWRELGVAGAQTHLMPDAAGRAVAEGADQRIARQELGVTGAWAHAMPDAAGRALAEGADQRIARQELGVAGAQAQINRPAAANGAAVPVTLPSTGALTGPSEARLPKTWAIGPAAAYRLAAPPDRAATAAEIKQLQALAAQRGAAALQQIAYWDAGSPSYRWVQIALNQLEAKPMSTPRMDRAMALMNVAIYDALVAARDSEAAYRRPGPQEIDPTLKAVIARPQSRSYPSEHAVVAGAASAILSYLYPSDAATFDDLAQKAARSRLLAGVAYPSDVRAGLDLGRAVAQKVIERGRNDGSDKKWTGSVPAGPGTWNGTNPIDPLAGTWQTWVLKSGSELRPPAPPAYDSPQKQAELQAIKTFTRTFATNAKAMYWQTFDGISRVWYDMASTRLFEQRLDQDALRAARDYAAMSVAHYEGLVACFDAKYAYWAIRPFQLDPKVVTLFPTPNHPSYPAAHGCASGAISGVMEYLYPADAQAIHARANEAATSRLWAGIHYQSDIDAGLALGRAVAQKVIDQVKANERD